MIGRRTSKQATMPAYSRAFEALVQGADDVIGLLAYATYKQSIREAALAGQAVDDRSSRDLTPALVGALRMAAEQTITEIVNNGIAQATPDIQNTATIATLNGHRTEVLSAIQGERQRIESHVTSRTGFLPAFLTNLAAWGVTLLIAVAILFIASRPSVESTLTNSLDRPAAKATPGNVPPAPKASATPSSVSPVPQPTPN